MSVPKEHDFLYLFPLDADSTVIEIGTYTGIYSEEIYRRHKCNVFAFEPVHSFYLDARKRLGDNPKITISNFGVAATERKGTITVKGTMSGEFADGDETRNCAYMSIRQVLDWATKCDLLAINCEGGEFEILEWLLANDAMAAIPNLLVQFHRVVEDCEWRYTDIQEGLKRTHEKIYDDGWVWQKWRRK